MKTFNKALGALACITMLASGCTTTKGETMAPRSEAPKLNVIDAEVDNALAKLDTQVPASRELIHKARGVLVFPSVISAGLVVGGSYGKGALREGSRTAGYYSTTAASVGLTAGAESKAIYVLFMTQDSLARFEASHGWTAGADASVTVLKVGADGQVTTQTAQQPIVGFVLTNGGLMVDLSIEGTKFTRIEP